MLLPLKQSSKPKVVARTTSCSSCVDCKTSMILNHLYGSHIKLLPSVDVRTGYIKETLSPCCPDSPWGGGIGLATRRKYNTSRYLANIFTKPPIYIASFLYSTQVNLVLNYISLQLHKLVNISFIYVLHIATLSGCFTTAIRISLSMKTGSTHSTSQFN